MNIEFFAQEIDFPNISTESISRWLTEVIESKLVACGSISIVFCSDHFLLNMNRDYLNHDYFTDIITFDYSNPGTISGDLFISVDTVEHNANIYDVDFSVELNRVMVHGILHLLGYDDIQPKDKEEMTKYEDFYLETYYSKYNK